MVDNDTNTTTEDQSNGRRKTTDAGDSDPDGTPLVVTTAPVEWTNKRNRSYQP
jgi:hypothetical protein